MWKNRLSLQRSPKVSGINDDRLRMSAERFQDFSKKLKQLEQRVRVFFADLQRTFQSRSKLMDTLSDFSRETPLNELVCSNYTDAALDAEHTTLQLSQFQKDIVSYVGEWETTVSTRVAAELKHIMALYSKFDKYQQKVEAMSVKLSKQSGNKSLEEKIRWNESKLRTARKEYRRNLIAVTLLTEEVTDRGWKDLIPLLIRLIDFDVNSYKNAKELVKGLSKIREELLELSRRYEMDFEAIHTGRLRILREEDAADFVEPQDLHDLESTIVHSFDKSRVNNNNTPPCSDRDSHSTAEGEEKAEPFKAEAVVVQTKEDEEEDSAIANYPRSIYVGEGPIDDETTLTGVPDLASV